jgi:hypothetical protein
MFPNNAAAKDRSCPTVADTKSAAIGKRQWAAAIIVTLVVGVVPTVMWPGAVSWMCDEPMLIAQAHYYNAAHMLAVHGLNGNMFVPYGPLPTQIYQLMLLFTHDPRTLVAIRAFGCATMLIGSFLWLAKTLRLSPWFAAAVMLAPYLWWSERVLWDASFALPIGALGAAAYASFLATNSRRSLIVAVAALTLVPLIHLQGLPLFAAFIGHLLWRHPKAIRQNAVDLAIVALAIGAINLRYIGVLIVTVVPKLGMIFHHGYGGGAANHDSRFISFTGPFRGGLLLAGEQFATKMNTMRGPAHLIAAAVLVSKLVIPLIWVGIVSSVIVVWRRWKTSVAGDNATSVRAAIAGICLACLLLQIMLAVALRIPPYPQYCFGTFPIHVLFAWFGIGTLMRVRLGILTTLIWGSSLAFITLGGAWQLHRYGWSRDGLSSPSLDDQVQIAQTLNRYDDEKVWTNVDMYQTFPQAIRALRVILPPGPAKPGTHSPHGLFIRYVPEAGPESSRIELVEMHADSEIPAKAFELDVTPWPRAY